MIGKIIIFLLIMLFFIMAFAFYKDPLKLENKNLKYILYGGGGVLAAGIIIWMGFTLQGVRNPLK
jgi:hypothetical protein